MPTSRSARVGALSAGALFVVASALSAVPGVEGAAIGVHGRHYKPHEPVTVIANKVGPFNNPSETYQYFSLPFCRSAGKQKKHHDFGESLVGDRKVREKGFSWWAESAREPWRTW